VSGYVSLTAQKPQNPQVLNQSVAAPHLEQSTLIEPPRFNQTERFVPQASYDRPPPVGSSHRDLLDYYQSLSESYRKQFLDLEKEFFFQRQKQEQEVLRLKDVERGLEDRTRRDLDQIEQRYQQQLNEKDLQINTLQRQNLQLEEKATLEGTEMCKVQTSFARMEQDYKQHLHGAEQDYKKLADDVERERRTWEAQTLKSQREHEEEVDRLKRDSDSKVEDLKREYKTVTDELRQLVGDKNSEIQRMKDNMVEEEAKLKEQRNTLLDSLTKDKYVTELN